MTPDMLERLTVEERAAWERCERAKREVYALAAGPRHHTNDGELGHEWRMSIPARRDEDSDLVIGVALDDNEAALETIAALRAELEIERRAVERLAKFCEASIVSCSYEYCPVYDAGCDRGRDTNCHEVLAAWARRAEGGEPKAFTDHLETASATVKEWPEWKRDVLGKIDAEGGEG